MTPANVKRLEHISRVIQILSKSGQTADQIALQLVDAETQINVVIIDLLLRPEVNS